MTASRLVTCRRLPVLSDRRPFVESRCERGGRVFTGRPRVVGLAFLEAGAQWHLTVVRGHSRSVSEIFPSREFSPTYRGLTKFLIAQFMIREKLNSKLALLAIGETRRISGWNNDSSCFPASTGIGENAGHLAPRQRCQ